MTVYVYTSMYTHCSVTYDINLDIICMQLNKLSYISHIYIIQVIISYNSTVYCACAAHMHGIYRVALFISHYTTQSLLTDHTKDNIIFNNQSIR